MKSQIEQTMTAVVTDELTSNVMALYGRGRTVWQVTAVQVDPSEITLTVKLTAAPQAGGPPPSNDD